MSKYEFDPSTYEQWKPEDFPAGFVCPEGGTSINCNTGGWRSNRPIWDSEKCTNCMLCWMYCPDSCVKIENGVMSGIDYEHCKGCGVCVQECKFGTLELIPEAQAQANDEKEA